MKTLITSVVAVVAVQSLFATIELGAPFTDGAVLQRGMKCPVWGRAGAGSEITVEFAGQSLETVAAADGGWRVDLEPMEASAESRVLAVKECEPGWFGSTLDEVEVKDVLVGEVWFASGQSNMECPIWGNSTRYRDFQGGFMTTMTYLPCVRYVKNDRKWSVTPRDLKAKWCKYTPEYLQLFNRIDTMVGGKRTGVSLSAVAFYYARELYLALGVPVGIVDSSWGGTNIDAWTPRSGYEGCDASLKETAQYPVKAEWNAATDKRGPIGGSQQQPTVLYNGMVAAYAPMAMRGFIWYQGCHNSGEADLYAAKMHALYNGWAKDFENPALKLYFVQLAPYSSNWNRLVAAQDRFAAEEPNASLAVTADLGNFHDIHPNRKEAVAKRLVIHALKQDYGLAIPEDQSPVFRSLTVNGARASVAFDHAVSMYVYSPDFSAAAPFELAGADGVWKPAKIVNYGVVKNWQGKEVNSYTFDKPVIELEAEGVAEPRKVRYMGQPKVAGTVYNQASLPLGPFEASK